MMTCLSPDQTSLPPEPRASTYIGIFFVALATLMYEILLTRIFSVTMLYHFAFVALSLAMFGLTAGALVVYLAPGLFPPERLLERLALAAVAFPIAMVLSFMTELSIPFRVGSSVVAIYAVALTYVVIAVPFVISGVAICLVLTGFPARVSRLYAADLAGAALGCVVLIGAIGWSDGPTAVLWVAFFASLGGVAFASDAGSRRLRHIGDRVARDPGARCGGTHGDGLAGHARVPHCLLEGGRRNAADLREMELVLARARHGRSAAAAARAGLGVEPSSAADASSTTPAGHRRLGGNRDVTLRR